MNHHVNLFYRTFLKITRISTYEKHCEREQYVKNVVGMNEINIKNGLVEFTFEPTCTKKGRAKCLFTEVK